MFRHPAACERIARRDAGEGSRKQSAGKRKPRRMFARRGIGDFRSHGFFFARCGARRRENNAIAAKFSWTSTPSRPAQSGPRRAYIERQRRALRRVRGDGGGSSAAAEGSDAARRKLRRRTCAASGASGDERHRRERRDRRRVGREDVPQRDDQGNGGARGGVPFCGAPLRSGRRGAGFARCHLSANGMARKVAGLSWSAAWPNTESAAQQKCARWRSRCAM